ncbi:CRISPR-associated Cas1 family protein [Pseudaminobacter salicylatoxidans]|uniref:CRISPR-associated endonuclease Cas1 n=1 Tax=Pseudaminobacter salicylatoxidans TaxID=93369 RepID=A0A316C426_PSESE|nr:type II CRISPR-associated endonuclease Cas1 [Pseudaminobacter salicylatoxidans]PWJ83726.1 CRISPR-associated Cas1 family protein [Pseudaminobacter salicylatoxidans]
MRQTWRMERVVDIATDGLYLAVHRGFLTISDSGEEKGRVALDDIGALIVHAHGTTWSNTVFTRLAERNVPVVLCGSNHAPVSCIWPLQGHHAQGARMRAQLEASRPLKKRLWQVVIAAKIRMQGYVLTANGAEGGGFDLLARKVRSGDPDNLEAQAARRYWKTLFGKEFQRDTDADGANALLNYGYTVLRATLSRAICAAGLHPTPGIFHSNRANAFALADDLMEPYRPLVDQIVLNLMKQGVETVTPEAKRALTSLTTFDLETPVGLSPLSVQVQRFVHSLALSFETRQAVLELPGMPPPLALLGLGAPAP